MLLSPMPSISPSSRAAASAASWASNRLPGGSDGSVTRRFTAASRPAPEQAARAALSADQPHRPEIAGELSVSLNTVSTHIRRIYAKLGATDRSSAVQRGRELRLLSSGRA
jgi:LuxR family maltose regulon positive regulatory protein